MIETLKFPIFQIPSGVEYLSKVVDTLPKNCIYNKVVTGAGATSIALQNNENYIICVPFVELIKNKLSSNKDVFGFYKGVTINSFKEYVNDYRIPIKKIMVTYDSLEKIMKWLNPKDYHLLIDEYQLLFKSVVFRNTAVKGVLKNFKNFNSYCFMTATIMDESFILKELKGIPVYETDWEDIKDVTVESCHCESNVIHTVCFLIQNYLDGVYTGNAHLFVNSVEFIKKVVENCKLDDTNARAIWSQYNEGSTGLRKSSTLDDVKKINFYTSSVWVGTDIKDREGHVYIISDASKQHTLIDVSTEITQIIGRIRDTNFKDKVYHIYTTTRYNNTLSYEDYKKIVEDNLKKEKQSACKLNELDEHTLNNLIKTVNKTPNKIFGEYIVPENGKMNVDENLISYDLYHYKLTKCTYKVRKHLHNAYEENGFNITIFNPTQEVEELTGKPQKIKRVSVINAKDNFKDVVLKTQEGDSDFILWAYKQYDFLSDAIKYLGYGKIEELKYNITNVKRFTDKLKFSDKEDIIKAELRKHHRITKGVWISTSEMKSIMKTVYSNLNYLLPAKAIDILKYWECSQKRVRLGGEPQSGFILINELKSN